MEFLLNNQVLVLEFIDALRSRGASQMSFGSLDINFAYTASQPEIKPLGDTPQYAELTPSELDARLYAETLKL